MFDQLWPVVVTTILPVAELRGGIPLGMGLGLDPALVIVTAFVINCLIFFPIYFVLEFLYEGFLDKSGFIRRIVERAQKRGAGIMKRYEVLGLAIFVGIPLPITGVWTGTIIAWFLDLDWKKSFLAICLGVLISATIVSIISLGLINGFGILFV